jgi:hypothetical protein
MLKYIYTYIFTLQKLEREMGAKGEEGRKPADFCICVW